MIDRDPSDSAPRNVGSLQAIDQTHDVIGPTRSLPIIEFLCGHANILQLVKGDARLFGLTQRSATGASRR